MSIQVFDEVLPDPERYRAEALKLEYRSYDFGHCVFHGIGIGPPSGELLELISQRFPGLTNNLTFFRQSPRGQVEPHHIHTDVDMGAWTTILYLNPDPPAEDGTSFWTHNSTGTESSDVPHERSEEGRNVQLWTSRQRIQSKFNRLLVFPCNLFHSRSIFENYGSGDSSRLIQTAFWNGNLY